MSPTLCENLELGNEHGSVLFEVSKFHPHRTKHDTHLLPLLVVLAVTVTLVVLVLTERNTRDLFKLSAFGRSDCQFFWKHTLSSKNVTKAGLTPAIASAPNLAPALPLNPIPA